MRSEEIVRYWKDEDYQLGLRDKELAFLPDNPAGMIELTDADLSGVDGGTDITLTTVVIFTLICTTIVNV